MQEGSGCPQTFHWAPHLMQHIPISHASPEQGQVRRDHECPSKVQGSKLGHKPVAPMEYLGEETGRKLGHWGCLWRGDWDVDLFWSVIASWMLWSNIGYPLPHTPHAVPGLTQNTKQLWPETSATSSQKIFPLFKLTFQASKKNFLGGCIYHYTCVEVRGQASAYITTHV